MDDTTMDKAFVKRLADVVEANLESEQFGVEELATEMGISRSQIHRKLQSLTGQSVSQFIRKFRLQKAMEMLQNDVATAAEIAYRVGFGSPTYFNTSFHDFYGYPPGEAKFRKLSDQKPKPSSAKKPWLIPIGVLVLLAIVYFSYRFTGQTFTATPNPAILDKSIAVLPFKNLSEDPGNQYFADGMMEDILNHLSGIRELKTISRTSSERYRDHSKSLPQIADELGVSYVLEEAYKSMGTRPEL